MIKSGCARPRIIIIPDGGHRIGMGHVQQSTTLAQGLRDWVNLSFLTKGDAPVLAAIADAGFDVHACKDDDEIFAYLQDYLPDAVIFDSTEVGTCLVRQIRSELSTKIIICTNLTKANDYAHMVVLQRAAELSTPVERRFRNESFVDPETECRHFYGPRYWILRPDFYAYKERRKSLQVGAKRILLTFGGSDPTNLTTLVLDALLSQPKIYSIDILLGRHFGHDQSLEEILGCYPDRRRNINLHRNANNVAELMFNADLAITAAGLTMFESLCVGTPVIVIPQDQLQRDTYNGVMRLLELESLSVLSEMLDKGDFTYPGDSVVKAMEIGKGIEELKANILDLARGR